MVSAEHSSKKRKKHGSIKNATKKLRDSTNETGPDCRCKRRYKCLEHFIGVEHRDSYNGYYVETRITNRPVTKRKKTSVPDPQLLEPQQSYFEPIPVPLPNYEYKGMQVLKQFCKDEVQAFFTNLPVKENNLPQLNEEERDSDYWKKD
ncbi:hypothetical protein J6590_028184 [Homalodisca vitripennis]|nr:hypothetical protein J6590_028184 [Homalodisca vitripennis]